MVNRIFRELSEGGYVSLQNRIVLLKRKLPPRF